MKATGRESGSANHAEGKGCAKKVCRTCYEEKPITDFFVNRKARDGRMFHCKACQGHGVGWKIIPRKQIERQNRENNVLLREWLPAHEGVRAGWC